MVHSGKPANADGAVHLPAESECQCCEVAEIKCGDDTGDAGVVTAIIGKVQDILPTGTNFGFDLLSRKGL